MLPRGNEWFCRSEQQKSRFPREAAFLLIVPGEIRTPDLMVRSHALYPAGLQARVSRKSILPQPLRRGREQLRK
jgi:hypothetical protein